MSYRYFLWRRVAVWCYCRYTYIKEYKVCHKLIINEHIKNIFNEGELIETQVTHKFGNFEFMAKAPTYYNLDVIISVGYRVKSLVGTQFFICSNSFV